MKRGQITLFIILGIIIFAIFGILFFLKNYVTSSAFEKEQQESTELFTSLGKYSSHMQACLDLTAKAAVSLVGLQGGVIYDYQAESTKPFLGPRKYEYGQYILPFSFPAEFDTHTGTGEAVFNVSYGIFAPDWSIAREGHPSVPEYPYGKTKLVEDPTIINTIYTQTLGNIIFNPLPPLCDYFGKNAISREGAVFSCETYDSTREADNDNIQEYIEAYVQQEFQNCVSLETLPEFANSTIREGNISVNVTFSSTSIVVDVLYPILGEIKGREATLATEAFHTTINVRLKEMHELATRLIHEDTNNVFFNIVQEANELATCKESGQEGFLVTCLKEGMDVVKYRDVCLDNGLCATNGMYDDVVIIKDTIYTLNGKPYVFAFAIQNRYPALDIIRGETADETYDYVVTEGDTITIDPYGYDPDEDDHNDNDFMDNRYIYGLWKEDYDEDPSGARTIGSPETIIGFTDSAEWDATQRTASYTTNSNDVGSHTLQVQICDNEGLCDFQYVEIYVEAATS